MSVSDGSVIKGVCVNLILLAVVCGFVILL